MIPSKGSIIEGIGDEVIITLLIGTVTFLIFGASMFYWLWQRSILRSIDPQNQDTVNSVREEIGADLSQPNQQSNGASITCPICLGSVTYGIETNCGHVFCGRCMITYWRHGHWIRGLRCPVCRSQVNLLLRSFTSDEHRTASSERDEIVTEVNTYNRRHSGDPISWMDYLRDLPTLLRHLVTELFSVSGLVVMFRLRILLLFTVALLYFLSPLDIIPEAVFGILGFLDDLFILGLLAIYVSILYRQHVVQRG